MTEWQGVHVLVTGGASFIGSHLCERLISQGAIVRVADDLSSGKLENLAAVRNELEFLQGDLKDPAFAAASVKGQAVVFHLAACHGGRGYIDSHPVECSTNLILDGNVFKAANEVKVKKVCFASSACVYPVNLQEKPTVDGQIYLQEDMANPLVPGKAAADGEYGWAKLMGEMALSAYHRQYGLNCVSCRIFTAYGERENETHAVIALIAKAFVGLDPYPIWGNGEQDRNFTYVGDIADGLIRAAERISDGSAINIGTNEHITILRLAEMIFEKIGFQPKKIQFEPAKPVGVFSRAASLENTRRVLDWVPQTSLSQGLDKTIAWYISHKDVGTIRANLEKLLTER